MPNLEEIKKQIAVLVQDEGLDLERDKIQIALRLNMEVDVLREMFQKDRHERLLKKAEQESEDLLDIDLNAKDVERKYGRQKVAVMKMKQAESMFLRESLGKDLGYSKRSELTGPDGGAILIKEILFQIPVPPSKA